MIKQKRVKFDLDPEKRLKTNEIILWTTVHRTHQAFVAMVYGLFQFQPFQYEFYQFPYLNQCPKQQHEPKNIDMISAHFQQ